MAAARACRRFSDAALLGPIDLSDALGHDTAGGGGGGGGQHVPESRDLGSVGSLSLGDVLGGGQVDEPRDLGTGLLGPALPASVSPATEGMPTHHAVPTACSGAGGVAINGQHAPRSSHGTDLLMGAAANPPPASKKKGLGASLFSKIKTKVTNIRKPSPKLGRKSLASVASVAAPAPWSAKVSPAGRVRCPSTFESFAHYHEFVRPPGQPKDHICAFAELDGFL